MHKAVLVDDERMAVNAIAKVVKWEKFGFDRPKVFYNAADAFEYISENSVDLLITDIRMPQMNGIELSQRVNELSPDTKIILASAYRDFNYALEALRLKVFDYIVKPFSAGGVEELLKKVEDKLIEDSADELKIFGKTEENAEVQKLMTDFIEKRNANILERPIIVNGVDLRNAPIIIFNIRLLDIEEYLKKTWRYGITGLYNAINNIIGANPFLFSVKYSFDNITLVFLAEDMDLEALLASFEKIRSRIITECMDILELGVTVELLQADISISGIADFGMKDSVEVQKKVTVSLVQNNDAEGASSSIEHFCSTFSDNADILRVYLIDVLRELINIFGTDEVKSADENYSMIFYVKDTEQLKLRLKKLCAEIAERGLKRDSFDIIKAANKYIMENLESGISITEVAEVVKLSPAYFGRVFREKTGERFLDYVNRMKIEEAMRLLATTNLKINEIYEKVGYRSRNYFYNIFRSMVGSSPQEYRTKSKQ